MTLSHHDWMRFDLKNDADLKGDDLLRGLYDGPLPLHATELQSGRQGDLIGTFWANVFLMSEQLKVALEDRNLSGWRPLPVVVDNARASGGQLFVLAVTGRSGPIYGAGGATRVGLDPVGQFLDPSTWDGSDMFLPENRRSILLSPRAVDSVLELKARNLELEPAGLEPI